MASSRTSIDSSTLSPISYALSQSLCRRVDRIDKTLLTRIFENPELKFSDKSSFSLNQLKPGLACDFFILAGCVPGLDNSSHWQLERLLWLRFENQYRKQGVQCAVLWGWLVAWYIYSGLLERTGERKITNDNIVPTWTCDFGNWTLTKAGERNIDEFLGGGAWKVLEGAKSTFALNGRARYEGTR
jgi:hypothetical protein